MKYLLKFAACISALILPLPAQRVGYIDLGAPPPLLEKPQVDRGLPAGCSKLGGGYLDGVVDPDDGKKRQIMLEVTKLSNASISVGSEFEAEVRLTNTDTHTIEMPWSTDTAVAQAGPDQDHGYFEVAEFDVRLIDGGGTIVWLKPLSGRLFGSQYATGTLHRIAPGEWVTARISIKVDAKYLETPALMEGKAQLAAEWNQWRRRWSLKPRECEMWSGTYRYDKYYEQKSIPADVTITKNIPQESQVHDSAK